MRVNGRIYCWARQVFRAMFREEKVPFPAAPAEEVFPGLYDRNVTLGKMSWKWGDLNNEKELIFLCALAAAGYGPIVEFGTFRGRTTYNLALNYGGSITTIDLGAELGRTVDAGVNVEKQSYAAHRTGELFLDAPEPIRGRITQLIGDSTRMDLSHLHGTAGLVIVDGGHSYEVCKSDTEKALRIVKPGGVIVWDDYTSYWPGVRKALDELSKSLALRQLPNEGVVVHLAEPPARRV